MNSNELSGRVERVEYVRGGAGNQWTWIDGKRYCTYFDLRETDWSIGDMVTFTLRQLPVPFCGPELVPHAWDIAKAVDEQVCDPVFIESPK